ncbi:hypothetical protein [Altericista sp. CCNU0014]|uniref:hypothetical protein n=1 Tax=Altericista sp. CCNU0014 TaxID=3082949 RepID=UPI00384F37EF
MCTRPGFNGTSLAFSWAVFNATSSAFSTSLLLSCWETPPIPASTTLRAIAPTMAFPMPNSQTICDRPSPSFLCHFRRGKMAIAVLRLK